MSIENKLDEIDNYIRVMNAYYMNLAMKDMPEYQKTFVDGKLSMLDDMRKRIESL